MRVENNYNCHETNLKQKNKNNVAKTRKYINYLYILFRTLFPSTTIYLCHT